MTEIAWGLLWAFGLIQMLAACMGPLTIGHPRKPIGTTETTIQMVVAIIYWWALLILMVMR